MILHLIATELLFESKKNATNKVECNTDINEVYYFFKCNSSHAVCQYQDPRNLPTLSCQKKKKPMITSAKRQVIER